MPSLTLSEATTNSCKYVVTLSSPFNTNYYKQLRITSEKHEEEPIYNVNSYLVSVTATTSTKPTSGIINIGMSAGNTYFLYAYAQALNGIWYLAGTDDITMLNAQTSKTLNMPACHNQKYNVYTGYFNKYCCGACSVAHIAEYYSQSAYSNDNLEVSLKNSQVISDTNYGATWSKCPSGKIGSAQTVVSYSSLYSLIKTEIDADKPVIIKLTGANGLQHFVVAYKYTNGAQTDSDIFVLDSANLTQGRTTKVDPEDSSKTISVSTYANGQRISLNASASYNSCPTYSTYMKTSRY